MNPESLQKLSEEAEDILESYLTPAERDEVFSGYKDISSQVRWGAVVNTVFADMLEDVYDLIFGVGHFRDEKYTKNDAWYLISDAEKALYEDKDPKGMARRHLLQLWVLRKLLGALKTRVNQSLQDIPILTEEEEDELRGLRDFADATDEDEEAMDQEVELVARLERDTDDLPPTGEVDLSYEGDCMQNGKHVRTVLRHRRRNDEVILETFCKDCRRVVRSVRYDKEEPEDGPCECEAAIWIEGKEGQEAVCSKCGEPVEDPGTYLWATVGLEPYGDDPEQDEVTTLCSDYSS